jgi:uncharacterized membrane protein
MTVPIGDLPPDLKNQVITQCESQACQQVKNQLVIVRNEILAICSQLAALKSQRDLYAGLATAFLAALAGVIIGIVTIPVPWVKIALIIAAIVLAIATAVFYSLAGHFQNLMNLKNTELGNKQSEFQDLVKMMQVDCPEQCRVDPTLPTCGN